MRNVSTLFDLLLYNALLNYLTAAGNDENVDGEHASFMALVEGIVEKDEQYLDEIAEIASAKMPEDMMPWDWSRHQNRRVLARAVAAVRRAGYMDNAPVPSSDSGLDVL